MRRTQPLRGGLLGALAVAILPAMAGAAAPSPDGLLVVGAGPGGGPQVSVFEASTLGLKTSFQPFAAGFSGGVRVATGDVNGDGAADWVVGAGPGGGPQVIVFDGRNGSQLASFFAFAPSFAGGVNVAAGDVTGDGQADVVVGAGATGSPQIRVFDGSSFQMVNSFLAYDAAFQGGVSVAVGDVNGDGRADIVTGAGAGGGPHVKVFSGTNGAELASFLAFGTSFTGGVNVATGDLDGDGRNEIIAGAATGTSNVRVFDRTLTLRNNVFALGVAHVGGVNVAAADLDGDRRAEIVVGAASGSSQVATLGLRSDNSGPVQKSSFLAFAPSFTGGVQVAAVTSGVLPPSPTVTPTVTPAPTQSPAPSATPTPMPTIPPSPSATLPPSPTATQAPPTRTAAPTATPGASQHEMISLTATQFDIVAEHNGYVAPTDAPSFIAFAWRERGQVEWNYIGRVRYMADETSTAIRWPAGLPLSGRIYDVSARRYVNGTGYLGALVYTSYPLTATPTASPTRTPKPTLTPRPTATRVPPSPTATPGPPPVIYRIEVTMNSIIAIHNGSVGNPARKSFVGFWYRENVPGSSWHYLGFVQYLPGISTTNVLWPLPSSKKRYIVSSRIFQEGAGWVYNTTTYAEYPPATPTPTPILSK